MYVCIYRGPMWLQCEECLKWRKIAANHYSVIPENWNCSQNPNPRYRCVFMIIVVLELDLRVEMLERLHYDLRAWSGDTGIYHAGRSYWKTLLS